MWVRRENAGFSDFFFCELSGFGTLESCVTYREIQYVRFTRVKKRVCELLTLSGYPVCVVLNFRVTSVVPFTISYLLVCWLMYELWSIVSVYRVGEIVM